MLSRLYQFIISIDQAINCLIGSGCADETLSAYLHRRQGVWRLIVNALFFWQDDHCKKSYESEISRRQYPPHYWTEK